MYYTNKKSFQQHLRRSLKAWTTWIDDPSICEFLTQPPPPTGSIKQDGSPQDLQAKDSATLSDGEDKDEEQMPGDEPMEVDLIEEGPALRSQQLIEEQPAPLEECEDVVEPSNIHSPQLVNQPYLLSLGLCFNSYLGLIICLDCGIGLGSKAVSDHLINTHSDGKFRINHIQLDLIIEELEVKRNINLEDLPSPCLVIEGFKPPTQKLQCNHCGHIRGSEESFRKHHSLVHTSAVSISHTPVWAQQINSSNHSTYFKVLPPVESSPPTSFDFMIEDFKAKRKEMLAKFNMSSVDPRQLSPWLMATRWHLHVDPFSQQHLMDLVALPRQEQEPNLFILIEVVHAYTQTADKAIDSLPLLALQRINSPLMNTISNDPFGHHQNIATTLFKYTQVLVQLFSFLLRPSDVYALTLPDDLKASLLVLRNKLGGPNKFTCLPVIHQVCMQLWTTEWEEDSTHTMADPTIRFLCLSQLKLPQGFKEVTLTTPFIAKLEYLIRLTMVYDVAQQRQSQDLPPSAFELAKQLSKWFTEHSPSTFNSLRQLQHLGSSIAYSTMSLPKIWWTDTVNFNEMLYKGYPVKLDQIREMLALMEEEMVSIWEQDILLGFKIRADYGQVSEALSNTDVDYSFLSDHRNPGFQKFQTSLAKHIYEDKNLARIFIKGHLRDSEGRKTPLWNTIALRKWLLKYARLHSLALSKAEMTAGSASRGTEIVPLTWKNIPVRPSRGLFWLNKHLVYLCQYHKGSFATLVDKVIPHAFDAHISDMIVQDLVIARPFAQLAAFEVFKQSQTIQQVYDSLLFVNFDKAFTTIQITAVLQEFSMKTLAFSMGLQDWRHISIGFRRKLDTQMEQLIEQDTAGATIGALQAHHSRKTENRIYAVSAVAMASASADDIWPLFVQHSTNWQAVCQVSRGGSLLPYSQCMAKDVEKAPVNFSPAAKAPLAVSHALDPNVFAQSVLEALKTGVQQMVKEAVQESLKGLVQSGWIPPSGMDISDRISSRNVSSPIDQYSALGCQADEIEVYPSFPSSFQEQDGNRLPVNSPSPIVLVPSSSQEQVGTPPAAQQATLEALRSLLNNREAHWSSNLQRQAVMAVLNTTTDILAILTTGSGKSMLAIIPALLEKGQDDCCSVSPQVPASGLQEKAQAMDIPFFHYRAQDAMQDCSSSNLVLVSVELASKPQWKQWLSQIHQSFMLVRRFIFDEGQYPLTDSDFRPVMKEVSRFRSIVAPFIILSGTIPPIAEPMIKQTFKLEPKVQVFRSSSTNRPELQLIKNSYHPYQLYQHLCQATDFTSYGQPLAVHLDCGFYNSADPEDTRATILEEWRSGVRNIMVSTSAFSCGNDYPEVRLVVHAGTPRKMMCYIQEISRGGRDHKHTSCYLIPTSRWDKYNKEESFDDLLGVAEIDEMVFGSHPCNICSPSDFTFPDAPAVLVPPVNPFKRKASGEDQGFAAKQKKFYPGQAASSSTTHHSLGSSNDPKAQIVLEMQQEDAMLAADQQQVHISLECTFGSNGTYNLYINWKMELKYANNAGQGICWICHVPSFKDHLHGPFGGPKACGSYLDIIPPTVFYVYQNHKELLEELIGLKWPTLNIFRLWLTQPPKVKVEVSNLVTLFYSLDNLCR
ncbi:hypothetical protein CPB84DRAFT_1849547 [Gymnopilus junonius]|uniref:DNA 3'-5' helicase n=1 Tax=Gymnopilus junonius TaxID=109634 RepID=A0A9P5NKD5_GYMJU|nr:hypothetical protein CPB84DRAFT_1849547 [Gymnopilus junonius]